MNSKFRWPRQSLGNLLLLFLARPFLMGNLRSSNSQTTLVLFSHLLFIFHHIDSILKIFMTGKYLVFFFYPLDFTFVCPTEILAFNDRVEEFRKLGAEVRASKCSQFNSTILPKLIIIPGGCLLGWLPFHPSCLDGDPQVVVKLSISLLTIHPGQREAWASSTSPFSQISPMPSARTTECTWRKMDTPSGVFSSLIQRVPSGFNDYAWL